MMKRRQTGRAPVNLHIGLLSIFVLLIVLCLATLATLSAASAQAQLATTERQAAHVAAVYANEVAAQEFVADAADAGVAGNASAHFEQDEGATLDVSVEVGEGGAVTITRWEVGTNWENTSKQDTLWQG